MAGWCHPYYLVRHESLVLVPIRSMEIQALARLVTCSLCRRCKLTLSHLLPGKLIRFVGRFDYAAFPSLGARNWTSCAKAGHRKKREQHGSSKSARGKAGPLKGNLTTKCDLVPCSSALTALLFRTRSGFRFYGLRPAPFQIRRPLPTAAQAPYLL